MLEKMKRKINVLKKSEDGVGVVEVILILVVLIGLVAIFKTQMQSVVTSIFNKITSGVGGI